MNILFLTRRFYPHIGGVEKHVFEISKLLVKKKYHIRILTEQYSQRLRYKETIQGIKIIRISISKNAHQKKYSIWFYLFQNLDYIKNADIIHCHDVFFWYLPFRILFPLKKVYTTFHGYEGKFPIERKAIIVRRVSNFLSNGSIHVGKFIKKWYGTKSTFTTYGGVDKNIVQKSKFKNQSYSSKIKIMFIGRLEKDTGIDIYLKSLMTLKKMGLKYTFSALGDGSYRKKVEKYGRVYGFRENIENVIKQHNIVFASSYLSILESLALKKHIIAVYTNPLKKDYLAMSTFADYITIVSSAQEIANQIQLIRKNTVDKKKIDRGYVYATKHTWEQVTNLYTRLWKENKKRTDSH